jgi:hypothetical protein
MRFTGGKQGGKGRWRGGDNLRLGVGDEAVSKNGRTVLTLQGDGNLVLYDTAGGKRRPLWASDTNGKPVTHAVLQHDGNFVVYHGQHAQWDTQTNKNVGADLAIQDDGNMVVYDYRNKPIWASNTDGFRDARGGSGPFAWVGNAVKTAGRAVSSAVGTIAEGAATISKAIGKVPIVGPLFHASFDLAIGNQLQTVSAIVHGERIDRVVLNHFKNEIGSVKEIAPYVQTIISFVPGIGPGISGAIGAGLALAQGKRIDEALLEGVKAALPGGALAKAAFDMGKAVATGKPIEQIALSALPLPDTAKQAVSVGLTITRKLASGERVDKVALETAIAQLPPDAQKAANAAVKVAKGQNVADVVANVALEQGLKAVPQNIKTDVNKALQTGVAMGAAQTIQKTVGQAVKAPAVQGGLAAAGMAVAKLSPVATAARQLAGPAGAKGFDIGLGLMQHKITPLDFHAVRDTLTAEAKKGFDMAVSQHIGHVTKKAPPGNVHAQAAFLMTHGMKGAALTQTTGMLKTMVSHPEAAKGVQLAAKQVGPAKPADEGWFHRLLKAIGVL